MTGFLDLPPEIRNKIYFSMESLNASLLPKTGQSRDNKRNRAYSGQWIWNYYPGRETGSLVPPPAQPSICMVNHQIRNETLPIFYGANIFRVKDDYWPHLDGVCTPFPEVLQAWLKHIWVHIHYIQRLKICCSKRTAQHAHEVVSALTDLGYPFNAGVLEPANYDWEAYPTIVYDSSNFLESAGAILFKLSTRQICLIHHKARNEMLLPKGRRDIGEARETTAIRETEEETGFKCRLLPVTMTTMQPKAGYDDFDGAGRQEAISEPFMCVHRIIKDGVMKMIWWYVAVIDEDAEVERGEPEFETKLFGFKEALEALTFQSDLEVVSNAIEIFRQTFDKEES